MMHTATALAALFALAVPANDAVAAGKGRGRGAHVQMGMSGGRLGAQISSMTEELRGFFGAPLDAGVLVGQVENDSPAAKAGVKVGDVIVEVNGEAIDSPTDIMATLSKQPSGAKVSVVVVRDKKRQTLSATLRDAAGMGFGMGQMNMDMDMDAFDMPKGMHVFRFGSDEIEKLEKRIEDLVKRLEKLESKAK
jgi:C-terminal processing protease CtpA/Prc